MRAHSGSARQELVRQVHDQLLRDRAPRLQLMLVITLSGLAAFGSSLVGLRIGIESMAVRYPVAVACGYTIFFVLIRWWISWQRRVDATRTSDDIGDLVSGVDLRTGGSGSATHDGLFAAGRSGGAGGGENWAAASLGSRGSSSAKGASAGFGGDLDELWWIVLVVVCVLGGVVAIAYIIYAAPALLAEVALDAAVVSTLYRRLRKDDVAHWAMTVLRKTWLSAAALVVFAAVGGYGLEQLAPDARSIGGVVRTLRGD